MPAKKLAIPVILIFLTTLAFKISLSSDGHKAGNGAADKSGQKKSAPAFFGDCDPADRDLKFMSEEWGKSHRARLADGKIPGCDNKACYACHITAAPHAPGMQGRHVSEYKNRKDCYACHVSPGTLKEGQKCPGYKPVKGNPCLSCHSYDSCNECHQAMKGHDLKFKIGSKFHKFKGHGKFLEGKTARSCAACHKKAFCNDCHIETKQTLLDDKSRDRVEMHPMFVANGMAAATDGDKPKNNEVDCSTCHTELHCASCHLKGQTLHPKGWKEEGHAKRLDAVAKGSKPAAVDRCNDCHKPEYCQRCHKAEGMLRSSHEKDWVDTHVKKPESKTFVCVTCHSKDSCDECHEISLPHGKKFAEDHKAQTLAFPDTCAACHKPSFCMSCHVRKLPEDHEKNKKWYKEHKTSAKAKPAPGPELAEAVKIRMKRMEKKSAAGKAVESPKYCNLCHDEKGYCGMCHTVSTAEIAHKDPDQWKEQHQKTVSLNELRGCAHCHEFKSYCYKECHKENEEKQLAEVKKQKAAPKGSIPKEQLVEEDHKLCVKCHLDDKWTFPGAESCKDCHKDITRANKLAIHMSDCTKCHTPHKWKIAGKLICAKAGCHEDIAKTIVVPEHKKKDNCADCHNSKKAHEWASAVKFSVCATCHRKTVPGKVDKDKKNIIFEADGITPVDKLHAVGAHERCGTCHGPHEMQVKEPVKCMACHREKPLPKVCTKDKKKKCSDPACHPFKTVKKTPAAPATTARFLSSRKTAL